VALDLLYYGMKQYNDDFDPYKKKPLKKLVIRGNMVFFARSIGYY